MPIELSASAILITAIAPILVATGVFFALLHSWIEKTLQSDPAMQQRLQLAMANDDRIAWSLTSEPALRPWPRAPLIYTVLAGLAVAAAETALFASGSAVPSLWYRSGGIASGIALLAPFIVTWLFSRSLHRHIDRKMMRCASASLAHTLPTLAEIGAIARRIDAAYGTMGLRARTDVADLCRRTLLAHAGYGDDAALPELVAIKNRLEYDLHSIQYCAYLLTNALAELERAKGGLQEQEGMQEAIERADNWIHSRDLAELLEGARWPEATEWLDTIRVNLRRLPDRALQDCTMPRTVQDAQRILNVTNETPLDKIRAVVSAFQRVWHPDLAHDEIERQRCTSKMQQINAAWDFIRDARIAEETPEQ